MKFDLEKRAREMFPNPHACGDPRVIGMRLAREALVAQAEEIAGRCLQCSRAVGQGIYWDGYRMCGSRLASDALSFISKIEPEPEKTREQELEDFVRDYAKLPCACGGLRPCLSCRARRLLEKKP